MLDKVVTLLTNRGEWFKNLVDDLAIMTQHQVDKAHGILRELVGGQELNCGLFGAGAAGAWH